MATYTAVREAKRFAMAQASTLRRVLHKKEKRAMSIPRLEVYDAINSERTHQDNKWGGHKHDAAHSLGDWLVYIDYHLTQAKAALSTDTNGQRALASIRKISALGVACMEQHGAPKRRQ